MANVVSPEDRVWLAGSLRFIGLEQSGVVETDIHKLADAIAKYVYCAPCLSQLRGTSLRFRLISDLGLQSNLTEYRVPKEDALDIATRAVGGSDNPLLPQVVKLVQNLY